MKKFLLLFACASVLIGAAGVKASDQTSDRATVIEFFDKVAKNPVEFAYFVTFKADGTVSASDGNVILDGRRFRTSGDGIESVCDGSTIWMMDSEAREMIIETMSEGENDVNPTLMIAAVGEMNISALYNTIYQGKSALRVHLNFEGNDQFSNIIVYISDDKLLGAEMETIDGISIVFDIPSFRFLSIEEANTVQFSIDEKKMDSSWVITDLR